MAFASSKSSLTQERSKGSLERAAKPVEEKTSHLRKPGNNFTKLNKQSTMLYLNHHPANGAVMDNFMRSSHGSFKVPVQRNAAFDKAKQDLLGYASKTQVDNSIQTNETV